MVLIEATAADALSSGAAAEALLALAATGAGVRSTADLAALASTAGWQLIRTHPLGWGLELLDLRPTAHTPATRQSGRIVPSRGATRSQWGTPLQTR